MKTITLLKEKFVNKRPDLFAKLVWNDGKATLAVHDETAKDYIVYSNMDFVNVPKDMVDILK